MNEKIYRVLFFIFLFFALLFAGASVFVSVRCTNTERELGKCRTELERVRTELANATNQQQQLEEGLNECARICEDTDKLLNQSVATISGLREQIRAIRTSYEAMEACLRNYRSSNSTRNCDTGNNSSEKNEN
jgi:septal ring factor EnvC (AmiA/AmiB activator)